MAEIDGAKADARADAARNGRLDVRDQVTIDWRKRAAELEATIRERDATIARLNRIIDGLGG